SFTAPCGIGTTTQDDPADWTPPPFIDQADTNAPSNLCALTMRTLTDPDTVNVTSIGAVNPNYTRMPDGSSIPATTTILGGGTHQPQDPQNAPTPIVEMTASGSMNFLVPVRFRDLTDTKFEGQADGVLEMPYDEAKCPIAYATDTATGLPKASSF